MRKIIKFFLIFIFIFLIIDLFSKNLNGPISNIYSKNKKYKEGDIILIVINENTIASQSNEMDLNKRANVGGEINLTNNLNYKGNAGFHNSSNGKGTARQSNLISTYLSSKVVEVKENGNLLIEGYKEIEMNENKQKIIFTGEINPIDIYSENYVDSSKVANLKISYIGDGILGNKSRPGILTQIFDWLRLF